MTQNNASKLLVYDNPSIFFMPHIAVDLRNFEVATLLSDCYQIEIYQIWLVNFSIRKAYLWLSLRDFQFHLKEDNMLSLLSNGFTPEFPSLFVIFKKWIGFCLINAYSVSHIFFLLSAEFFCKGNSWLSSWGWAFIWDNNNSQAREKLIVSWRKSGNFKISYVNGNVIVGSDSNTGYYSFSVNSCIGNIFTSIFSKAYVLSCFRYSLDL